MIGAAPQVSAVSRLQHMFAGILHRGRHSASLTSMRCSFCGKDQDYVKKLIAGPTVFICDECVEVCNSILADDSKYEAASEAIEQAKTPQQGPVSELAMQCALCRMPIVLSDGLPIAGRGILCAGCLGEIEAAVAGKREPAT